MFLWALCFPLITIGLNDSPPMFFAANRALMSGLVLLILAQLLRRPAIHGAQQWGGVTLVGVTATSIGLFGMFYGGASVSPGLATVIANTQPLMAAVLAWHFLKEPQSRSQRNGLLIAFGGIILIGAPGFAGTNNQLSGLLLILLSAVAIAISNVVLKRLAGKVDGIRAMGWQFVIGAIPLYVLALYTEQWSSILWTGTFITTLLVLSLFGTATAFVLWFALLSRASLTELNVYTFLTPVFGMLIGYIYFDERLSAVEIVGIAVCLLGIAIVSQTGSLRRRASAIDQS